MKVLNLTEKEHKLIEEKRATWSTVAKQYGWYKDPFFVQIWINEDSIIEDSVSFEGLTHDIFIRVNKV